MTRYAVTDPSSELLDRLGGIAEYEDTEPFDLVFAEELTAKRGDPLEPLVIARVAGRQSGILRGPAPEIVPDPDGAVFVENGEAIPGAKSRATRKVAVGPLPLRPGDRLRLSRRTEPDP